MHGTVGRPPFKATKAHRRKVKDLAAKGMSQEEIADAIGVGKSTLVKYFSNELIRGRAQCRRDLLTLMWTAANRGRVGAILWLEQRIQEAEPVAKPLGKKAAAQLAAQTAGVGTAWETLLNPQPPKLPKAN